MSYNQKLELIISLISRKRNVSVAELKKRLQVSEVTIRKYLDALESEGIIVRTHGGAMMAEDRTSLRTVSMREETRVEEKRAIARAARSLITEGDTVFLDSGTTCRLIAREIRDMNLQVLTNSLDVMIELSEAESISLFCLGGTFRREARTFIGAAAAESLRDLRIAICFLGASGFSIEGLFYSQNLVESQLKRQVLTSSKRRAVAADSSKLGIEAFSIFARPGDVDLLIVDAPFSATANLAALGIEVVQAERGQEENSVV